MERKNKPASKCRRWLANLPKDVMLIKKALTDIQADTHLPQAKREPFALRVHRALGDVDSHSREVGGRIGTIRHQVAGPRNGGGRGHQHAAVVPVDEAPSASLLYNVDYVVHLWVS